MIGVESAEREWEAESGRRKAGGGLPIAPHILTRCDYHSLNTSHLSFPKILILNNL